MSLIDLPDDAQIDIRLHGVDVRHQLSRVPGLRWYAVVYTAPPPPPRSSPWDYMDDGPGGDPEIHTEDFAEAVAWIRETAAAHIARKKAEEDAAEAAHAQAEKEARNARRRARAAAKRA